MKANQVLVDILPNRSYELEVEGSKVPEETVSSDCSMVGVALEVYDSKQVLKVIGLPKIGDGIGIVLRLFLVLPRYLDGNLSEVHGEDRITVQVSVRTDDKNGQVQEIVQIFSVVDRENTNKRLVCNYISTRRKK